MPKNPEALIEDALVTYPLEPLRVIDELIMLRFPVMLSPVFDTDPAAMTPVKAAPLPKNADAVTEEFEVTLPRTDNPPAARIRNWSVVVPVRSAAVESAQTREPLAVACARCPNATAPAPEAVFRSPPSTVEVDPDAKLFVPPSTDEKLAYAPLDAPPPMIDVLPSAALF